MAMAFPEPGSSFQTSSGHARGGRTTARRHGADYVEARGRKGGMEIVRRYGRDYFRHIRMLPRRPKKQAA
jgi:hypothetical protein